MFDKKIYKKTVGVIIPAGALRQLAASSYGHPKDEPIIMAVPKSNILKGRRYQRLDNLIDHSQTVKIKCKKKDYLKNEKELARIKNWEDAKVAKIRRRERNLRGPEDR